MCLKDDNYSVVHLRSEDIPGADQHRVRFDYWEEHPDNPDLTMTNWSLIDHMVQHGEIELITKGNHQYIQIDTLTLEIVGQYRNSPDVIVCRRLLPSMRDEAKAYS